MDARRVSRARMTGNSPSNYACPKRSAARVVEPIRSSCSPQGMRPVFMARSSLLAARTAVRIHDASVDVTVDFSRDPTDGLFVLSAHTRVHLPGVERAVAEELVRKTEWFCPYTKMARQGIVNVVALVAAGETSES